jgi:hypothetical protein
LLPLPLRFVSKTINSCLCCAALLRCGPSNWRLTCLSEPSTIYLPPQFNLHTDLFPQKHHTPLHVANCLRLCFLLT